MVGPVAKLAPEELPVAPNLRSVGRQPSARLPAFLRGFDVGPMPFALNAATRAISPTKALEYMAARTPIVSTPVPDVVATWPGAVRIAAGADAFIGAMAGALAETTAEHAARVGRQAGFVAGNAWDRVAEAMGALVDAALAAETADARAHRASPVGAGRARD